MEVDVRRQHPLGPPSLLPSAVPRSSPLLPVDSLAALEKRSDVSPRTPHPPVWETLQPLRRIPLDGLATKFAPSEDPAAHRSLLSASLTDSTLSPSHSALRSSPTKKPTGTGRETVPHPWSGQQQDGSLAPKPERSSSRGRRGRVEQSIEASLANPEPASHVRSRKSSHYLGLFKENTTSPDRKRRDERGGRHDEFAEPHDKQQVTAHSEPRYDRERRDSQLRIPSPSDDAELPSSKSLSQLSLADAPVFPPSPESETFPQMSSDNVSKPLPILPESLLEEIRNFHLTPGGARGTSFSRSIPTQFSERSKDYFTKEPAPSGLGEQFSPSDTDREQRRGSGQFEDEDDELISSAVYFPHERVTVSEEVDQVESFPDSQHGVEPVDISTPQSSHVLVPKRHAVSEEPEANHVDISLRSKNDSRILHGDLQQGMQNAPIEELNEESLGSIPERAAEYSTCESEFASADDSGMSVRDEESSVTDEAEVTPTATPTQRSRIARPRRKHESAAPLGAVELKPYRHQVGGHTTVFRFSRRAVCKQLNNRENEFYERIERRHPEMLMFLPRYIGVLNVTFSKTPKRPKASSTSQSERPESANATHPANGADKHGQPADSSARPQKEAETQRIFSQKQVTGIVPQVILENNRHIIPADLFSRCQRPRTADGSLSASRSFSGDTGQMSAEENMRGCLLDGQSFNRKQWGATTVNTKLQEQVLREVFSPPAIHHHRRHARGHLNLPRTSSDGFGVRRRANLSEDQTASSRRNAPDPSEPVPSAAIEITKQTSDGPGLSSSASTALEASHNRLEKVRTEDSPPRSSSLSRSRPMRRRRSGSGLQRRGSMGSGQAGGELLFYEDDGYGGDKEDGIFSMEGDTAVAPSSPLKTKVSPPTSRVSSGDNSHVDGHALSDVLSNTSIPSEPKDDGEAQLPSNPKEAQTRKDDRVQFFLLLEDLTAGMNKPCVLDLKMGTRQYGIEANEKKRKSQRRKCQSTTSQELGVRLCGMQTWNVKKQEYSFEDKYFGRDLKSGRDFQDALTRFLYDGASYRSVAKKIPVILDKLAKLENMIRRLKRYRLYASSLLILYDGDPNNTGQASQETNGRSGRPNMRDTLQRKNSDDGYMDVQLKIVDFANCVTGEDELSPDAPCPPQHPDDIDRGYLRGLRSLRMYFQRILKEITQDDYVERGEGEAIALGSQHTGRDDSSERYWDENVLETDPGEVSF
ncbi:inositol hexaphosphate kinase Kcs1 [Aspergillus heteromorphus CBS 117.55]|uniref:Kinase n=1 Tax=Aspergillus heteromorphus CBS 117.55 TaxID=1448321 RepID=A0A317V1L5_9EURO|nr:inositol hexaphosphate kinase Kcs1 [Aspergillus heteromorphus CBS 117.55]PWY66080.1 inositol hexaphosphate kinase Kcs1 [Aspergillus heteromorphus CBS 117.55]